MILLCNNRSELPSNMLALCEKKPNHISGGHHFICKAATKLIRQRRQEFLNHARPNHFGESLDDFQKIFATKLRFDINPEYQLIHNKFNFRSFKMTLPNRSVVDSALESSK